VDHEPAAGDTREQRSNAPHSRERYHSSARAAEMAALGTQPEKAPGSGEPGASSLETHAASGLRFGAGLMPSRSKPPARDRAPGWTLRAS
jgi:hypothetical protein